MNSETTIFDELQKGATITPEHPQISELRAGSYTTIRLVQQLNASSGPEDIRRILSEITGTAIDETVAIFPPISINYGKHLSVGKKCIHQFQLHFAHTWRYPYRR